MRIGLAKRNTLLSLTLATTALLCGGCELIPGLFNNPSPDPVFTTAPLTVFVDEVEGTLDGTPLQAHMVEASGSRTGETVDLDLQIPSQSAQIMVSTGSSGSDANPYGDEDPGVRLPGDPPAVPDAGLPGFAPNGQIAAGNHTQVLVCSPVHGCLTADDVDLSSAQGPDARTIVLDGSWVSGDRLHIELHYNEAR